MKLRFQLLLLLLLIAKEPLRCAGPVPQTAATPLPPKNRLAEGEPALATIYTAVSISPLKRRA